MTIYPQHDRILVRRDESESVSAGGIVLPETVKQDRPQKGQVLAVGPGKTVLHPVIGQVRTKPLVAVGDVVIFAKYAGEGFKIEGEEVFLVKDEDILAVLDMSDEPKPGPTQD